MLLPFQEILSILLSTQNYSCCVIDIGHFIKLVYNAVTPFAA